MSKVIDIQLALEQAGGNEALAKDLLTMLLKELPVLNDKLQQAIHAQDNTAMWDHAHKLYGSTAYCGVPGLKHTAKSLEDAIKQRNQDVIIAAHGRVFDEITLLLAAGPGWLARSWS